MSVSENVFMDSSHPSLPPIDSTSDGNASLVSILTVCLFSKLKDEESLTDDILDVSRSLIDRVMAEIDVMGPAKSKECLHGVGI